METIRFDYNGTSGSFKRTPQGFLRVKARLSRSGVFDYKNQKEFRSDDEVFREDSLNSIKGAPVTDLHPSEKGNENFLSAANAKNHIIGLAESVEREGNFLKGSLIIFHEDAIKAIENGERKEISLGYQCQIEKTPGTFQGQSYDAVQKNIIVNHIAIGPKGWGRAGPECSIKTDSNTTQSPKGKSMKDSLRLDGVDIALNADSVKTLFSKMKDEINEYKGRLDAIGQELEKEKSLRKSLEDPEAIKTKVNDRIALLDKCRGILGDEEKLDSLSSEELKLKAIKKVYPDLDTKNADSAYLEGVFATLKLESQNRNDSLSQTRASLAENAEQSAANTAYEKWLVHSTSLWQQPLSGRL